MRPKLFFAGAFVFVSLVVTASLILVLISRQNLSPDDTSAAPPSCGAFVDSFSNPTLNLGYWRNQPAEWTIANGDLISDIPVSTEPKGAYLRSLNELTSDFLFEAEFRKPVISNSLDNGAYTAIYFQQTTQGRNTVFAAAGVHYHKNVMYAYVMDDYEYRGSRFVVRSDISKLSFKNISFKAIRRGDKIEFYYKLDNNPYSVQPFGVITDFKYAVTAGLLNSVGKGTVANTPALKVNFTKVALSCLPSTPISAYCGNNKCETGETCEYSSPSIRECTSADRKTRTSPSGKTVACNGKCDYCGNLNPKFDFQAEQCDTGSSNGLPGTGCSATCFFDPNKVTQAVQCNQFAADDFNKPHRWFGYSGNLVPTTAFANNRLTLDQKKVTTVPAMSAGKYMYRIHPISGDFKLDVKAELPNRTIFKDQEYGLRVAKVNNENFDIYVKHVNAKTFIYARAQTAATGVVIYTKSEQVSLGTNVYFRIVRKNNALTGFYSLDGVTYKSLGGYTTSTITQAFPGVYMNTTDASVDQTSIWSDFRVSCN